MTEKPKIKDQQPYLNTISDKSTLVNRARTVNFLLNTQDRQLIYLETQDMRAIDYTGPKLKALLKEKVRILIPNRLKGQNSYYTNTCPLIRNLYNLICNDPDIKHVFLVLYNSYSHQLLIKDVLVIPYYSITTREVQVLNSFIRNLPKLQANLIELVASEESAEGLRALALLVIT